MAVAHVASLGGLADLTDTSSYTSTGGSNPTGAANTLLIATILVTGSSPVDPPSIAGHGVSWSVIQGATQSTNVRVTTYQANGSGATSTKLTVSGYGTARSGCAMIVDEFSGVATSTIGVGSGSSVVQVATDATGTGSNGPSNALAAYANAANRPYASIIHAAATATTVDASPATWAELGDQTYATPPFNLEAAFNGTDQETTYTPSWTTSSAWTCRIFEINGAIAAGGGTSVIIAGIG